jgi:hypothetical protein
MIDVSENRPVKLADVIDEIKRATPHLDGESAAQTCIRCLYETPNIWRLNVEEIRKLAKYHNVLEGKVVVEVLRAWYRGLAVNQYMALAHVLDYVTRMSGEHPHQIDLETAARGFRTHKNSATMRTIAEYAVDAQIALSEYVDAWNRRQSQVAATNRRRAEYKNIKSQVLDA